MILRNKWARKVIAKVIQKIRLNSFLLKKIHVTENKKEIDVGTKDIVGVLEQYSKKPEGTAICDRTNWNCKKQNTLSIIVPVYNVEKYIHSCIESLLKQKTKYQYQIIIINDGSPDQSRKRIEKFIHDKRILYIEQNNKGLSGARNRGLENMNSEYIAFVDGDDYVSEDFVQIMIQVAMERNADIVQGGFSKFMFENLMTKSKIYKEEEVNNKLSISGFAWGKVFRSTLFKQIQFPEGYWYEDSIMTHLIYPQANKIVTIPNLIYFYRTNWKGISKYSVTRNKCIDSTWILVEMLNSRRKLGLDNTSDYLPFFLEQLVINYRREFNVEEEIKKAVFLYSCTLMEQYFEDDVQNLKLTVRNNKLFFSLKNRDYCSYKKICYLSF